jgi:hypothetical protein
MQGVCVVEDFYQTYPSNTYRFQGDEGNSSATFGVNVRPALEFQESDSWQVGLTEIYAPGKHINVARPFNNNIFQIRQMPAWSQGEKKADLTAMETTTEVISVDLTPGLYDEASFCRIVNSIVVKAVKSKMRTSDDLRTRDQQEAGMRNYYFIKYKEEIQRYRIVIPPRCFVMCYNPHMQKRIGWARFDQPLFDKVSFIKEGNIDLAEAPGRGNSTILANARQDRVCGVLLPEPCDFSRDNKTLYVYCNLVKDNLVGNVLAPLLRMVDLGLSAKKSSSETQVYRSYPLAQYHTLKHGRFESVDFLLKNGLGESFPFQSGSTTTIVLHFRKIKLFSSADAEGEKKNIMS